ncbi:MAG TPA: papain-like cysteine protease family protein [Longimicrobiales bacterium]|nr:papain-like cysteine protease family protein [Longimicrobiales bacterium]
MRRILPLLLAACALPAAAASGAPLPAALGAARPAGRGTAPSDSVLGPGTAVPFVAQGPLLCGGAAAAMLERFWGARGVYASDYAHLLRPGEPGIRGTELARVLESRGLDVTVRVGDASVAVETLARGQPVMLLIGSGAATLHYVVLTALDGTTAWVHDPNRGPSRPVPWRKLHEAWAETRYWSLVASPADAPDAPRPRREATGDSTTGTRLPAGTLSALRTGRTDEARRVAHRLLGGSEADASTGWRLLATARYVDGDRQGALAAWNRVEEPRVDLLEIQGLHHVRFHPVAARMGIEPGTVLTPRAVALARRRVALLPVIRRSRVDYRPEEDGSVTVQAAVVERPRWPFGTLSLASTGLRAVAASEASLVFGPLTGASEQWVLHGQWGPARTAIDLSLSATSSLLPGVVSVEGGWMRERFGTAGAPDQQERRHAAVTVRDWVAPSLLVGGVVGLERWNGTRTTTSLGLSLAAATSDARAWLGSALRGWASHGPAFGRLELRGGALLPSGSSVEYRASGGATLVSAAAPRLLWPGAGAGRVRAPLLRGHALVEGGAIRGAVFGRGLAHVTVERFRYWRFGPVRAGWAAFLDLAGAWSRADGGAAGPFLDPGVGLRLELDDRTVDVSMARGEEGWRWSAAARTGPPWSGSR